MAIQTIRLSDGAMNALVVRPRRPRGGAVVVIQEIFGVNDAMRQACDMIADLGFVAVCPDLFWRLTPGIDLDASKPAEFQEALSLMGRFDQDSAIADLNATLAFARALPGGNGKAGTMGYCLGGRLAMMMALRSDANVNISYYGVGLDGLVDGLDRITAPLLLHVAGEDKFFPAAGRSTLIRAVQGHAHVKAWTYPGADHGFARIGGDHYDGLLTCIANGRSAGALGDAIGGE
jgi:carboxymethylenebutenolidase